MSDQKSPTVLTLDAGGTNFVFSAIRDYEQVIEPITLPSNAHDLEKCLATIITGFEQVANQVGEFIAISFAFPGPADYELGIIEDLPNFKAFNGGVPLGPMLKAHFKVPVFINNDGNLFASGVARAGFLPELNNKLADAGSKKRFNNVIGITLGTGLGCGIVCNGQLLTGDNSCAAEIHSLSNPFKSDWNIEESVSTRAIKRVYAEEANLEFNDELMPKEIFDIAKGNEIGNIQAAIKSFELYGKALGVAISNVITLVDGIVVLGGGLSAAWELFAPAMFDEVNSRIEDHKGERMNRLSFKVFNLEDPEVFDQFAHGEIKRVAIPGTEDFIEYDALHRSGIGVSKMDISLATSLGAYAYALQQLNNSDNE